MDLASEGARTPFITSTPSKAVIFALATAGAGLGFAVAAAGAAVPVAFAGVAGSGPGPAPVAAMTKPAANVVSTSLHSHFFEFDIEYRLLPDIFPIGADKRRVTALCVQDRRRLREFRFCPGQRPGRWIPPRAQLHRLRK